MGSKGTETQLLARGPQDLVLYDLETYSDSLFAPLQYKQYGNFAAEMIEAPFLKEFSFGTSNKALLSTSAGDFVGEIFLEIDVPPVAGASSTDFWRSFLGYHILRRIRLRFDDVVLADQERLWYDIHDKLFCPASHSHGLKAMLGASHPLSMRKSHTLLIPLKLPFCRAHRRRDQVFAPISSARPSSIFEVDIQTESFAHCIGTLAPRAPGQSGVLAILDLNGTGATVFPVAEGETVQLFVEKAGGGKGIVHTTVVSGTDGFVRFDSMDPGQVYIARLGNQDYEIVARSEDMIAPTLRAKIVAEYISVDAKERAELLSRETTLLVEAVQDVESTSYNRDATDGTRTPKEEISLQLAEVTTSAKYLTWVVYIETIRDFVYLNKEALGDVALYAHGQQRTNYMSARGMYGLLHQWWFFPNVESSVHCMSFALEAAARQPSGIYNLATAKDSFLKFKIQSPSTEMLVKAFITTYNLVTFHRGAVRMHFQ
jgi:hypothetical protein